jgi:hypothetical protein
MGDTETGQGAGDTEHGTRNTEHGTRATGRGTQVYSEMKDTPYGPWAMCHGTRDRGQEVGRGTEEL